MTKNDKIISCKCGKSDIRQNMWHNPISDDIKCDSCFLDCLTTCLKIITEPKGLRKIIQLRIFGMKYPKIITEYYKGSFQL